MKSSINSQRPGLLLMASVAAIIMVTAFSIEFLYQFLQYLETTLAASARQAQQITGY